jgi:hypothetical protein
MAMELKVDTDAEEVGFDAGRLERIDRHFARYVEEGDCRAGSSWSPAAAESRTWRGAGTPTSKPGGQWRSIPCGGFSR